MDETVPHRRLVAAEVIVEVTLERVLFLGLVVKKEYTLLLLFSLSKDARKRQKCSFPSKISTLALFLSMTYEYLHILYDRVNIVVSTIQTKNTVLSRYNSCGPIRKNTTQYYG